MADLDTGGGGGGGGKKLSLKKIPKPVLYGGAVAGLGLLWYLKKQSAASSAAATAANSTNATPQYAVGDTSDTTGSGYDIGFAAGQQSAGGSDSGGIDPTTIGDIISALYPNGVPGSGATAPSDTTTPPVVPNPINVTVNNPPSIATQTGGGAPTGGAAGGTVVATTTGGATPPVPAQTATGATNVGATPFDAATTPIATQIADYESGKISYSQLGVNAKAKYAKENPGAATSQARNS